MNAKKNGGPFVRGGRLILKIILFIILLLAAIVIALPSLLSLRGIREFALARARSITQADIRVQSLSLGWLSGVDIRNITYQDAASNIGVRVDSVVLKQGLLAGLLKRDFGVLEVARPEAVIRIPAPVTAPAAPPASKSSASGGKKTTSRSAPPSPAAGKLGLSFRADLAVTQGRVSLLAPGATEPLVLNNLTLQTRDAITLEFDQGANRGHVKLSVQPNPERPAQTAVTLKVSALELAALRRCLPAALALPDISGQLDAQMRIEARPEQLAEGGRASGEITVTNLAMRNGFLKTDRPQWSSLRLIWDAALSNSVLHLNALNFTSPMAQLTASGQCRMPVQNEYPQDVHFRADGELNVAEAAQQLPALLMIQSNVLLKSAAVQFSVRADSESEGMLCRVTLDSSDFIARQNLKTIELRKPLQVNASVRVGPAGFALDSLAARTAFASINGSASNSQIRLAATADLAAAGRELAQILDLKGRTLAGTLDLAVRVNSADAMERSLHATVEARNLRMKDFTPGVLSQSNVIAMIDMQLDSAPDGRLVAIHDLAAKLNADLLASEVHVERLMLPTASQALDMREAQIRISSELADISAFLHAAGLLEPTAPRLTGNCEWAGLFAITSGVVDVKTCTGTLLQFGMTKDGRTVTDPQIRLAVSAACDLASQSIGLRQFSFTSTPVAVDCAGRLDNFQTSRNADLKGWLAIDYDELGKLVNVYQPGVVVLGGASRLPFALRGSLGGTNGLALLKQLNASFDLSIPQASAFGLNASNLLVRLPVTNGVLDALIAGGLNSGAVRLQSVLDARPSVPTLHFPPAQAVLDNVQLNDQMVDALLARVHPIFKGCNQVRGRVGLTVRECDGPLDSTAAQNLKLAGAMRLTNVSMQAGGMLKQILDLTKSNAQRVSIPAQDVQFRLERGRLAASPLQVEVSGNIFVMSGSVGLDGTLDYSVEVPVTPELLGKDGYALMKGGTIRLPIGGTVQKPAIDSGALEKALAGLVTQAAKNALVNEGAKLLQGLFK